MKKLKQQLSLSLLFSLACFFNVLQLHANTSSLPISVQLWSVKESLQADFEGTLVSLSKMGFDGVEFAGEFGPYADDPNALKAKLDALNLKTSSAHVSFDALSEKNIHKTLLFYKTLGTSLLFVPWDQRAWSAEGVEALSQQLNKVNEIAKKFTMKIGFHNHNQEFNTYRSATFWDYIAQNTDPSLPLQLDIGWVLYAGKSPQEFIRKYPQRTLAAHLKIRTHKEDKLSPILGENHYPWPSIIKTLQIHGGTQWLVVEQEEYPAGLTPLQSVAKSKQNLDRILAQ